MNQDTIEIPFCGHSMDPIFKNAKSVWVDFSTEQKFEIGDVILYRDFNNEWICHRLIFVDKQGFWLKGDANAQGERLKDLRCWGRVSALQRGERLIVLRNTILTKWLCHLQKHQVASNDWFFKKFYRSLAKVFLMPLTTM